MDIKELIIKCALCNSIDICKYHVFIYNCKNELICDNYTNENGVVHFKPTYYGIYKIKVVPNKYIVPNKICTTILISKNYCNRVLILFNKCPESFNHPIKVKLTDKNYKGLPIKKGEIILWQ